MTSVEPRRARNKGLRGETSSTKDHITLRIPYELHKALEAVSRVNGDPVAQLIRRALREFLAATDYQRQSR